MAFSNLQEGVRFLNAAHRDARSGSYRERVARPNHYIECRSLGERKWWEGFRDALKNRAMACNEQEFSIKQTFVDTIPNGRELVEAINPNFGPDAGAVALMEAGGAVTSGDFSNITGQILYTRMMQDLTPENYPFQQLLPNQSTQFSGEKIPGIANLGDQAQVVAENKEFPYVITSQDYIETPATTKRGFIVPVTKEAIFFDRTGMLLQKCGAVGDALMLNKEKRCIDCIVDENTTTHEFKWKGTVYASYQSSTPWINVSTSNTLTDWSSLDKADQILNAITDPNTGEPVVLGRETLICTKQNEKVANRIARATSYTVHSGGYATSGNLTETTAPNPYGGLFDVFTSRQLAARMATDTTWYYGDVRKYGAYMENWPITVTQAPAGNYADFTRDIVSQFKCSERGQYVVLQPRVLVKCTV